MPGTTPVPKHPDGRTARWTAKTPAERRAATAAATAAAATACRRRALDQHIDALVAAAPDFTEEQQAKLRVLLAGGPA
jgi:alkylhydroperoxidase family enzyme